MLGIIIVIAAVIGLLGIYYVKLEETKKKERLKVTLDDRDPEILNESNNYDSDSRKPNDWKRKTLDYKAIHEAYNKADYHYSKNDLDEALKGFIQVTALHPDHIEANNKLGLIYLKRNMPKKAETAFRHLISLDPTNAVFYGNLALSFYAQSNLEEAKYNYEKAIQMDPKKASRYMSLGQVCVDLKNWKAAINAYSKAIELNPKDFDVYFIVAELLIKVSAFDESIAFMEAVLEMQPYNEKAKELIREARVLKGANPLSIGKNSSKDKKSVTKEAQDKKNQQSLF